MSAAAKKSAEAVETHIARALVRDYDATKARIEAARKDLAMAEVNHENVKRSMAVAFGQGELFVQGDDGDGFVITCGASSTKPVVDIRRVRVAA